MPSEEPKKPIPPFWWPDLKTFVAVTIVTLFAATIMLLLLRPMPITGEAGTLLTALVGLLGAKVATIVDFCFGTSQSSANKDEAAKTQAQTISDLSAPTKVIDTSTTAHEVIQGERPKTPPTPPAPPPPSIP